jgi:membrane fusion protein, multidrug efflux system
MKTGTLIVMNETETTLAPRAFADAPSAKSTPCVAPSHTSPATNPPSAKPPGGGKGRWIALVALIALAALGWKFFRPTAPEPTNSTQSATPGTSRGAGRDGPQPVGVATIEPRDVKVVISALGTVTPLATVTVVSQISGYLQEVAFTEGQHVKKGDFLAQIDPRPYQALKAQYEGQLAHDQGLLEQARADDARYQLLLKQNSIARQTAENQIYIVKQYEGTVRADQALIDAQALNIAYSHIVSPVDGRVGLRLVDAGNYVQAAASTGIAVITQLQPMSVLFSVTEDALGKIQARMRDGGKLIATAYDRANVKLLATGAVTVLDNQVDTTTGMVKLRAQFDNKDEALFPNQFVNIRLLVDTLRNAVATPTAAVQHGAPGDYTYVVDAEGKARVRVLKLGQTDGDYVAVTSGLSAGDVVVIDGADRLREGAAVRVVSDVSRKSAAEAQPSAAPAKDAEAAPAASTSTDPAPDQRHHRRSEAGGATQPGAGAGGNGGQ